MEETDAVDRRTVLKRTGVAAGTLAIAGCVGNGDDTGDTDDQDDGDDQEDEIEAAPELLEVEDPPNAVYVPTHREAMRVLDPIETGDVAIAPMLSYPHPFWTMAGADEESVERAEPEGGRGVHLMFTLWDRETGIVLPVDEGAQLRVETDGEQVGSARSPWTMISQEMGFHFGDNVSLPEDGTYTAELELPPLSVRTTGALDGRFGEPVTATFEFGYDDAFRQEVIEGVEYFDEAVWGAGGAIEPMDHGDGHDDHNGHDDDHNGHDGGHGDHHHPYSELPAIDDYPGTLLASAETGKTPSAADDLPSSDDARVLATLFEDDHRLSEDGQYLLVSPRTPYNRVPLADASLSVTIERDGEIVTEAPLEQTIDGEYDLHYGASVSAVESGDTVRVEFNSPPQVARHQGYETAFLDMGPVEFEVPDG